MKHPQIAASLITGIISFICSLIGEFSFDWLTKDKWLSVGLFAFSGPGIVSTYNHIGSVVLARALVTCGFLASIGGLSVLVVYYVNYIRLDTTNRNLPNATAFLCIIGAPLAMAGVIVFATLGKRDIEQILLKPPTSLDFGYSFALTVVGSSMSFAAGSLAAFHVSGLQN